MRDSFRRRTATPAALAPWIAELVRTLPGLVRSYAPGAPLAARTRERVILAVTEVNGDRYCAWIHGAWQDLLGDTAVGDAEEALLAFARACADAGRPLDPSPLADVLPPDAIDALRATVAQIEVSNLVGNSVDGLLARLTRQRPLDLPAAASEAAAVAVAAPVAAPLLAAAALMRVATRLAPPFEGVELPPEGEANLLVDLITQAAPTYLANALVRLAVLRLPFTVSIGVRSGRTNATVRIGRGRVAVGNGIAPDAVVVVEGDVDPLLQLASGSIVRELRSVRIRPS